MIDLRFAIVELFVEAQHLGRKRHRLGVGWRVFRGPVLRAPVSAPVLGRFVVRDRCSNGPYVRNLTIPVAPCKVERYACDACGGLIEWREGLSRGQAVHLGRRCTR